MRTVTWKIQTPGLFLAALVWPAVCAAQTPQAVEPARAVCLRCAAARAAFPEPAALADADHRAVTLQADPAAGQHKPGRPAGTAATTATRPSRKSAVGWGIAIGIGGGIGLTGAAASRYGNNEGGKFCTRCFVQWSAVAVPVGAGIGAAVGYLIDRARR